VTGAPGERMARGKQARSAVPRSAHAAFDASTPDRDPIAVLEQQAETRVAELIPLRYGRMLASPSAFYRGGALVMACDLARTPTTGISVQVSGDAHLNNFGLFASPERRLVFDVNDFDETLPGPWEWDVKRLVASLVIAARGNGIDGGVRRQIALDATARYRRAMRDFASMGNLAVWYAHVDARTMQQVLAVQLAEAERKLLVKTLAKAQKRDHLQALGKLTRVINGERRFISDPPLVVPITELLPDLESHDLDGQLQKLIREYGRSLQPDRRALIEQFRVVDIARKVVGVGSVGTRTWVILLLGRDDQDPLFLQAKEAQPSVLEAFVGKSEHVNHGQRVVTGQRLMQATSDIFLGWEQADGDGQSRDFYVRQLRDGKGSVVVEMLTEQGLSRCGELCGWTLARAHARSGDRFAIAGYLGTGDSFDRALAEFAEAYADQNERDYQVLADAVASGRVTAQTGL
jgi:uncharacterized protein (DUF2252 family)